MSVVSVVLLRFLALLKWFFQSSGIILSLFILSSNRDAEFMAIASIVLIVIPELIMGSFLWIFRGVCSVCKKGGSEKNPVFGSGALIFSTYHYITSLASLGLSIGLFMEIPILLSGIVLVASLFLLDKIKLLTNRYFQIYC